WPGILEGALFDHQFGAAFLPDRWTFFSWLEDELDRARELSAHSEQDFGHSELDRGVRIMPARMLHVGCLRSVWDIVHFLDRKRVHICADGDHGTRKSAFEHGNHAMLGDSGADVSKSDGSQPIGNDLRGALFTVRELGVHMEVASLRDDLFAYGGCGC